ncbi:MAG: response regulator [Bacteroidota bacterium]|nr:response regulator [Bacteroidota bacterium]
MKKHIVIIEDDRSLQETMQVMLEDAGYKVTTFGSPGTVEELAGLKADLFIIDERLPFVSGHILCIMLHGNALSKAVPQVLISASPMLAKFAELGEVDASLRKPFGMEDLLAVAERLLL